MPIYLLEFKEQEPGDKGYMSLSVGYRVPPDSYTGSGRTQALVSDSTIGLIYSLVQRKFADRNGWERVGYHYTSCCCFKSTGYSFVYATDNLIDFVKELEYIKSEFSSREGKPFLIVYNALMSGEMGPLEKFLKTSPDLITMFKAMRAEIQEVRPREAWSGGRAIDAETLARDFGITRGG